jgi:hypothetical protein
MGPGPLEERGQRLAGQVLHQDVGLIVMTSQSKDLDDLRGG